MFLCHIYCELGATPAVDALKLLNGFLKENPNEVVVLIIEDHVSAADFESRGARFGSRSQGVPLLSGHAPAHVEDDDRVAAQRRVHGGERVGQADWYPNAYEGLLEDTPYRFESVDDFTCATARGELSSPLFLMNHWLSGDPASQTVADIVNGRDILAERVDDCRLEQDRLPNLIAVDFYSSGDVFTVVNELNGVGAAPG